MIIPRFLLGLLLIGLLLPAVGLALDQPVTGQQGMVVTAHPAATEVGLQVLRDGGNAVDAAVAVAFALAVCEPYSSGLGGGGFFVTFDAATGASAALDARETAPATASRDMYLVAGQADPDLSRYGPLSVAVPGLVRGLEELHRKAGHLSWQRLIRPARTTLLLTRSL